MCAGLFLSGLVARTGYAQLSFQGTYRPRTELRDGYRLMRTDQTQPAFFTSQRTRLGLNYQGDQYRFHMAVQDVRTWGDVEQLKDHANLNVHEAWAAIDFSPDFTLKMGRQELVYDDQRLLGSVNWTQQARSHDAAVMQFNLSGTQFHIGGAYNQDAQNVLGNRYTLNNYKVLSYLWGHHNYGKFDISVLALSDGFQVGNQTNFRYTYGTFLTYGEKDWNVTGTAYLQNGDDASRRNIAAYMLAGSGTYNAGIISLTAGYDYLSGGSANDSNSSRKAFNTLYATNHKFYGNMDYFLNVPADTRGGGLQDLYLKSSAPLSDEVGTGIDVHHFALAQEIADPKNAGSTLSKSLGSEIDSHISYKFNDDVTLKGGYSVMFSSESLAHIQLKNDNLTQHWGWIMLSLTPSYKF